MRHLLLLALLLLQPAFGAKILRVDIDSVVHPITVEIVSGALEHAQRDGADVVLVYLDTPGGLIEASRKVVDKLTSSPIPVITYVAPSGARAASAGFFLLLAGDVAAMAPGTRTGAASPVMLGRELDPVMRRKIESDTRAWLRSLASERGRNVALAEKTVSDAQSFTAQEALDGKLIDLIAVDDADLFRKLNGRQISRLNGQTTALNLSSPVITIHQLSLRQRIFKAISDPNVAFLLLVFGALGLYVEFTSPGLVIPGVLGALFALFGLAALSVLPIYWLGAALIVLALALFVLEAKFTSYGVLGVGGAIAMVLGAMLLVEGPPEFRIGFGTALAVALPVAIITTFLTTLVFRAHTNRVQTGEDALVGKTAIARTPLNPEGKVFVHGEYWDATSSVAVEEGARVRVVAVEGLHLRVQPLLSEEV